MKNYYFDYNASTPLGPEAREAMAPFLAEDYANPSAFYEAARMPRRALREARRAVAGLVASAENEIVFTSGGTESNNAAIRSALAASPGKKRLVVSGVEHASIRALCGRLVYEGYEVREVSPGRDGRLDLGEFAGALDPRTALVCVMLANNETGILFPVAEIAALVKSRGLLFHVDAVQAAGKLELSAAKLGADYMALSAHKIYGPKGAGALYVRDGAPFVPLIFGGMQERGRRAGTENVAGIAGFGAAADHAKNQLASERERLSAFRDDFESRLLAEIPGVSITGGKGARLCNTSHMIFEGLSAETVLIRLDQKGISASSGSACMSGSGEPSKVLLAMGYSEAEARSGVRFSFGRYTTREEIRFLLEALREIVNGLRKGEWAESAGPAAGRN